MTEVRGGREGVLGLISGVVSSRDSCSFNYISYVDSLLFQALYRLITISKASSYDVGRPFSHIYLTSILLL